MGEICGIVSCVETGEPLIAASVYLKNMHIGAISDEEGNFCIKKVPPGEYYLVVDMIGFQNIEARQVKIEPGETVELQLELKQETIAFDECVTVTSTRGPSLVTEVPSSVSVVNTGAFKNQTAQNLAELLQDVAGVYVKDQGGLGGSKTLSLRGSTAGQVVVLLDGQRINNPQTGQVDLSTLSMEGVKRVEVVRGGNSALYGADAVGGVVNIITREAAHRETGWTGSVKATGASFNTGAFESSYQHTFQNWRLNTALKYFYSEGDFTYTNNYGKERQRKNADIRSKNLYFRIGRDFGEEIYMRQLELSYRHYDSERGAPGTIEPYYYDARMWDRNNQWNLLFTGNIFSVMHKLRWQNYYYDSWSRYYNDESAQLIDSRFLTKTYGSELQVRSVIQSNSTLTYGSSIRYDRVNDYQENTDRQRQSASVFMVNENHLPLAQGWLSKISLVPSLRYDLNSDYPNRLSPKLGAVINFGQRWKTALKTNMGLSYRAPTFNDLYWPEDAWTKGNPDLKPESGYDWDVGLRLQYPLGNGFSFESSYFVSHMQDLIVWQQEDNLWMPKNVQETHTRGIENNLNLILFRQMLDLNVNYTYMDARNLTAGSSQQENKRLVYRPEHNVNLALTMRYEPFIFSYQYQYVSRRYTDTANLWANSLSPYTISHVSGGYTLPLNETLELKFIVQVKNIFDREYRIIKNMPIPGRELRASVSVNKKS